MSQFFAVSETVTLHDFNSLSIIDELRTENVTKKPNAIHTVRDSSVFVLEYADERSYQYLTVKSIDDEDKILKVRKCAIAGLNCIAAPKKDSNEIAVGFTSGMVRCVDIKSNKSNKSFSPEIHNNPVCSLDYNCEDKYLASVLDNGMTDILNVQHQVASDHVKADKMTSMARFHCTKSTWLALASRQGIVSVYDLIYKKFVIKLPQAHSSIVKDISFESSSPDSLFSASYDATIKVYDMRRKYDAATMKADGPVQKILVHGNFVLAGTLSSTIELFDVRNYKEPVARKNLGRGQICSLTSVPASKLPLQSFEMSPAEQSSRSSNSIRLTNSPILMNGSLDGITIKNRTSDLPHMSELARRSSLKGAKNSDRLSVDYVPTPTILLDDSIDAQEVQRMNITQRRKTVKNQPQINVIPASTPSNVIAPAKEEKITTTPKRASSFRRHENIIEENEELTENKENLERAAFDANVPKASTPSVAQLMPSQVPSSQPFVPLSTSTPNMENLILQKLSQIETNLNARMATIEAKVDKLAQDLRYFREVEMHDGFQDTRSFLMQQNYNLYRMDHEHRESVEQALSILLDRVGISSAGHGSRLNGNGHH